MKTDEMAHEPVIHIACADDHPLIREGIISFIHGFGGMRVDIEADNGKTLIELLKNAPQLPDICLLDISMPVMNGFDTLIEIKKRWPEIKVIVLTIHEFDLYIIKMMINGASSYLCKNCPPNEMKKAITAVYENSVSFPDSVSHQFFKAILNNEIKLPVLTAMEMALLNYVCTDLSYSEIATKIGTTTRSVEGYRDSMFKKLHINSRVGLAMFAVQFGFVTINTHTFSSEHFLVKNNFHDRPGKWPKI